MLDQLDLFAPPSAPAMTDRERRLVAHLRALATDWLGCAVAPLLPPSCSADPDEVRADPETRRLWWKHAGQALDEVLRIERQAPEDGRRPAWLTEMVR